VQVCACVRVRALRACVRACALLRARAYVYNAARTLCARCAKVLLLLDRHGTVLKRIALQEHVRALAAQHVSVACISVALTSSWDALLVGLAHGEVRSVGPLPLPSALPAPSRHRAIARRRE
jgi:hypothetical protein